MNRKNIPKTDSIQELAHFWDTHDLTDFEDELEEVNEPIFELETQSLIPLESEELKRNIFDILVSAWQTPERLESINTQAKSLEYLLET